jgi:hypothetical protein
LLIVFGFSCIIEMTVENVNRFGTGSAFCGVGSSAGQLQAIFWSVCFAVKALKTSPLKKEDVRSSFEKLFESIANVVTGSSRRMADRVEEV